MKAAELTGFEAFTLDGIIEEAQATRGTRYSQPEAVRILVQDRYERGIFNQRERDRVLDYLADGDPPKR